MTLRAVGPAAAAGALLGVGGAALLLVGLGRSVQAPAGWTVDTGERPLFAVMDAADPPRPDRLRVEPVSMLVADEAPTRLDLAPALDPTDVLEVQWGDVRLVLRGNAGPALEGAGCRLGPAPSDPRPAVVLERSGSELRVAVGEATGRCDLPEGAPALRTGASRVHLLALAVDGVSAPAPVRPGTAAAGLVLGGLGGALLGPLLGLRLVLAGLPGLLAGLLLARHDPAALALSLRLPELASAQAAGAVGLGLSGFGVAAALAGRRAKAGMAAGRAWPGLLLGLAWGPLAVVRMRHADLGSTLGSAALGSALGAGTWLLAAALGSRLARQAPADAGRTAAAVSGLGLAALALAGLWGLVPPEGLLSAAGAGACLGLLLWANRNAARVRSFNLLSLACCLLAYGLVEHAVAFSRTAAGWREAATWVERTAAALQGPRAPNGADDRATAAAADFEDLDRGEHTAYPSRGYPVTFPPRGEERRLVALGGSSTGGAFQMDDLGLFWPARLDARLGPGVEVLNQGVGGWTTFHIARYLQARFDDLEPDLLVLYVGNNDAGRGYPATLAQLYETWHRTRDRGPLSRWLRGRPLVQWGLQVRQSAVSGDGAHAVSREELQDNLRVVHELARGRGIPTLLVGEANVQANVELERYHVVLRDFAGEQADVAWLDGQAVLDDCPSCFLDSVHLSEEGHERLAAAVAQSLLEQGLLPPGPEPAP